MRTVDLSGGFSVVATPVTATPPVNVYTDTTAIAEGRCYYKVRVLPQ
jgi:hypothetical protein